MVKVKKIIGIDVSKLTLDVYDGEKNYQFKNNIKGFNQLLKKTDGHYVMEATGSYHVKLASYLFDGNCLVSVVNPLVIKRFSQMRLIRAKTDRKDAVMIYEYAQFDELYQFNYIKSLLFCIFKDGKGKIFQDTREHF